MSGPAEIVATAAISLAAYLLVALAMKWRLDHERRHRPPRRRDHS